VKYVRGGRTPLPRKFEWRVSRPSARVGHKPNEKKKPLGKEGRFTLLLQGSLGYDKNGDGRGKFSAAYKAIKEGGPGGSGGTLFCGGQNVGGGCSHN